MQQSPFFIVLNAGSGHNDAGQTEATIREVLDRAGCRYELWAAASGEEIPTLAQRAVKQAQKQEGTVVVAGGDGTVNAVAQAALGCGRPFGVLPQGTFNYFGRTHGISQDTREATEALLTARVQPVQVGLVNERMFLVNASLGLYPQLLEDREAFKQRFGRSRFIAFCSGIISLLRHRQQLHIEMELEGQTELIRTPTLFVGNNRLQLKQIGIAEADYIGHEWLVAIVPKPVGTLAMLGLLLRGALGHLGEAGQVDTFAAHRLSVRPPRSQSRRRYKVAVDGEICWLQAPLVFRVAPEPLLLLTPLEPTLESTAT
ncbi:MAG: diacylglycerol/lipid kinase family protein [Porticoccaceae bacterium]